MYKRYLLLILIFVSLSGIFIIKPKEEVKLDNIILKQEVNNKTFAMYKEEGNDYVPVNDNKFPDMYVLNLTKSKCIDNNGNVLENILSYENDKVVLTTNKSSYCYLYFDKNLGLEIKEKNPNGLKTDKVRGEMYRFQGQQKDDVRNYICFGTTDNCGQNDNDINKYMYRIIGIEAETGRVKVIKKEALENTYQWYTDYVTDIKLPDSIFFKAINEDDFLNNIKYIPEGWKDKISDNTWLYGNTADNNEIGSTQMALGLFEVETGQKDTTWNIWQTKEEGGTPYVVGWAGNEVYPAGTTLYHKTIIGRWNDIVKSKISLIYLNDFSYSVGDDAKCSYYHDETEYAKCKQGWMHLLNNDTHVLSEDEWTMTRVGWGPWGGVYSGYGIYRTGAIYNAWDVTYSLSVRPVFYINASEELLSGTGTITDPFMIKQ